MATAAGEGFDGGFIFKLFWLLYLHLFQLFPGQPQAALAVNFNGGVIRTSVARGCGRWFPSDG